MIQASTLYLHAEHYSIHSPEQCWHGSLAPQAQSQVAQSQVAQSHVGQPVATNLSIAIDSGMGVAPIIALYRLWQAWEKAAAVTKSQETTEQGHVAEISLDSTIPCPLSRTSLAATGQGIAMHLVAVEPYPLAAEDAQLLFKTLAPDCAELQDLARQWPLLLPGMHRLELAQGRFTLSLLYGPQHSWHQVMANIDGMVLHLEGLSKQHVDAQIQQQRWRDILRISQPKVWALVAADEAHLLHELGEQRHTQWHEMHDNRDVTQRQENSTEPLGAPSYESDKRVGHVTSLLLHGQSKRPALQFAAQHVRQACIVGAGLAGAGIAYALALRGWRVKVVDKQFSDQQTLSHLGRLSAALTPLITADDSHKARLSRAGTLRAHARWKAWGEEAGINPCGTLELNREKGHAKDILASIQALQFPAEWVRLVDAQEASTLAGLSLDQHGAFFPYGMQISPLRLIHKLLSHPLIEVVCDEVESLRLIAADPQSMTGTKQSVVGAGLSTPVATGAQHLPSSSTDSSTLPQYAIMSTSGLEIARSTQVVLATALNTAELLKRSHLDRKTLKSGQIVNAISRLATLHPMGGEAMHVPADLVGGGPRCIVAGQGYLLPAFENYCVMGGTYIHNQLNPQVSEVGQEAILRKLPLDLGLDLPSLRTQGQLGGWAGSRAVVQGRMPVIGPLAHAPGIFLACAYASHGLSWSSLAGDLIAAYLEGEPMPIERDLWQAICPR